MEKGGWEVDQERIDNLLQEMKLHVIALQREDRDKKENEQLLLDNQQQKEDQQLLEGTEDSAEYEEREERHEQRESETVEEKIVDAKSEAWDTVVQIGVIAGMVPLTGLMIYGMVFGQLHAPPIVYLSLKHLRDKRETERLGEDQSESESEFVLPGCLLTFSLICSCITSSIICLAQDTDFWTKYFKPSGEYTIHQNNNEFDILTVTRMLMSVRTRFTDPTAFVPDKIDSELEWCTCRLDSTNPNAILELEAKELSALVYYQRALYRSYYLEKASGLQTRERFEMEREKTREDFQKAFDLNRRNKNSFGPEIAKNMKVFERMFY